MSDIPGGQYRRNVMSLRRTLETYRMIWIPKSRGQHASEYSIRVLSLPVTFISTCWKTMTSTSAWMDKAGQLIIFSLNVYGVVWNMSISICTLTRTAMNCIVAWTNILSSIISPDCINAWTMRHRHLGTCSMLPDSCANPAGGVRYIIISSPSQCIRLRFGEHMIL